MTIEQEIATITIVHELESFVSRQEWFDQVATIAIDRPIIYHRLNRFIERWLTNPKADPVKVYRRKYNYIGKAKRLLIAQGYLCPHAPTRAVKYRHVVNPERIKQRDLKIIRSGESNRRTGELTRLHNCEKNWDRLDKRASKHHQYAETVVRHRQETQDDLEQQELIEKQVASF
jgi:hypothetical protein